MSNKKLSTLLEILNYASGYLKDNKIENPRLNAELLLADVMNCKRLQLYLDFEKPLTGYEKEKIKEYLRRRAKREPLQYILGKTNFFGYDITINDKVLIPRQDTEILVEKILLDIELSGLKYVKIFEVGVGSGCIAVALLSELKKKNIIYKYNGIDISEDSLIVARKNLANIEPENYSLSVQDFIEEDYEISDNYDYVISNPPYVPYDEYLKLEPEVNMYEPEYAITDFGDGMKFYRKLLKSYKKYRTNYFLEIAYNSKEKLEVIIKEEDIQNYSFEKDYNDNYRVLKNKQMIAVVQRCTEASVEIEGKEYNRIGKGLMVLIGIKKGDTEYNVQKITQKILDLRIFDDEKGVMNLSVMDVGGELLIISQFTLCADNNKSGNRPSYIMAEVPEKSKPIYEKLMSYICENYDSGKIKGGVFGADMKVKLINDGPVTIILER